MLCEGDLTEKEIFDSTITVPKNKSLGNNGLTTEFFYINDSHIYSTNCSQMKKEFTVSRKQATLKLIEKRAKTEGI